MFVLKIRLSRIVAKHVSTTWSRNEMINLFWFEACENKKANCTQPWYDVTGFERALKLQKLDNKMKNSKQCEQCNFQIFFHFMISPSHWKFCFVSLLIFLKFMPMTIGHVTPFDSVKLINENSTLLHPLTNVTINMTSSAESEQEDLSKLPWWCKYSTGK